MPYTSCQALSRKRINTGSKESMSGPKQKENQYRRAKSDYRTSVFLACGCFSSASTCFRIRSNIRMKQLRFISSSSHSKSIVFSPGCPKFLKGLWKGLRIGLRNGLWKGLGKGLSMLCWTLRPGSEATLTWKHKKTQHVQMTVRHLSNLIQYENAKNSKNSDSLATPFCSFFCKIHRCPLTPLNDKIQWKYRNHILPRCIHSL